MASKPLALPSGKTGLVTGLLHWCSVSLACAGVYLASVGKWSILPAMIKFLAGVFIGICIPIVAGYVFIARGGIAMTTSGNPLPLERMLAHKAVTASIGRADEDKSPLPTDEANLLAGARIYQENGCQGCHGKLDGSPSKMAKCFYPHAPGLMPPSHGVTDDPVGETHWVVKNGIRFSADAFVRGEANRHGNVAGEPAPP